MNPALMMLLRGGSSAPLAIEYLGTAYNSSSAASYTFASQPLGAADDTRNILVVVHAGAGSAISSLTVAGQPLTIDHQLGLSDMAIARVALPTGTTGDVAVTFGAAKNRCAIGLYRVTGSAAITPRSTASATAASVSLTSTSVGDVVVVGAIRYPAITTDPTGYVERYDYTVSPIQAMGGDAVVTSGGARNISFAPAGSTNLIIAAAYKSV